MTPEEDSALVGAVRSTRVALACSYNGHGFNGWQSQAVGRTVQDTLEAALARFATVPIRTLCAGRTDAGVHGLMQVVHFDAPVDRNESAWVRGTNAYLPADVAVQWARAVPGTFHARRSATARRYRYILLQSPVRPSVDAGRVGWAYRPLDGDAMRGAAAVLLGKHDFTSFRASACQSPTPVKTVHRIAIERRGDSRETAYWRFDFEANAFLHHMIRNIMGCLVAIGSGLQPVDWMHRVLAARDRDAAAPTFSPDGLYFLGPVYDPAWGLPERTAAYDGLP